MQHSTAASGTQGQSTNHLLLAAVCTPCPTRHTCTRGLVHAHAQDPPITGTHTHGGAPSGAQAETAAGCARRRLRAGGRCARSALRQTAASLRTAASESPPGGCHNAAGDECAATRNLAAPRTSLNSSRTSVSSVARKIFTYLYMGKIHAAVRSIAAKSHSASRIDGRSGGPRFGGPTGLAESRSRIQPVEGAEARAYQVPAVPVQIFLFGFRFGRVNVDRSFEGQTSHRSACGRVPVQMWANPDVGKSRCRCGRVPVQMWTSRTASNYGTHLRPSASPFAPGSCASSLCECADRWTVRRSALTPAHPCVHGRAWPDNNNPVCTAHRVRVPALDARVVKSQRVVAWRLWRR